MAFHLVASYVRKNAKKPGHAAQKREGDKRCIYPVQQFHFVPVRIETLGSIGEDGLKFIGELMENVTDEKRTTSNKLIVLKSISSQLIVTFERFLLRLFYISDKWLIPSCHIYLLVY